MTSTGTHIERYRTLRAELERSILPLAGSLDGRRFTLPGRARGARARARRLRDARGRRRRRRSGRCARSRRSTHEAGDGRARGRGRGSTRARACASAWLAVGAGVVLDGDAAPFHDRRARPATPDEVRGLGRADGAPQRARLPVGTLVARRRRRRRARRRRLRPPHVPVRAVGLGQELLARARARAAAAARPACDRDPRPELGLRPLRRAARRRGRRSTAARWRELAGSIAVLSAHGDGRRPAAAAASASSARRPRRALLQLDPVADREEYAELRALIADGAPGEPRGAGGHRPPRGAARSRCGSRNLGIERAGRLGARPTPARVLDALADDSTSAASSSTSARCRRARSRRSSPSAVLDARSGAPRERPLAGAARDRRGAQRLPRRARRRADRARDRARGPDRGRGPQVRLYTCSWPPSGPQKVHENVLSQCDNLVLMRLNSAADAGDRARDVRVRPARADRPRDGLPPRRGARRGQARLAPGADPLRRARRPRGRRRRRRRLGGAARADGAAAAAVLAAAAPGSLLRRSTRRRRAPRGGAPPRPCSATSGSRARRRASRGR